METADNKKVSNKDVLVKTLDGKLVLKSEIADGEIYYNETGKKVKKVVKKVATKKQSPIQNTPQIDALNNANAESKKVKANFVGAEKIENNLGDSVDVEKQENEFDKSNLAKMPIADNDDVTKLDNPLESFVSPEILLSTEVPFEEPIDGYDYTSSSNNAKKEQNQGPTEDELKQMSFEDRVRVKHSFLSKIENNETVSGTNSELFNTKITSTRQEARGNNKNKNKQENQIDSDVKSLENEVINENLKNSLGKGSGYGVGVNKNTSSVSGAAFNPNGSVLNNPLSNADNPISKSLAGGLAKPSLAVPDDKKSKKSNKKSKPFNWLAICIPICLVFFISLGVYFFARYNFNEKSVNVGLYYIDIGDDAKLEYYDGEKINFYEFDMTYYYGENNIEVYQLGKMNLETEDLKPDRDGYNIVDGTICAVWEGDYEKATSRNVKLRAFYDINGERQNVEIPITIYRNILKDITCDTAISADSIQMGNIINPTVFGVYTNKTFKLDEEKYIKLDPSDYYIQFSYKYDGNLYNPIKIEYGIDENGVGFKFPNLSDKHQELTNGYYGEDHKLSDITLVLKMKDSLTNIEYSYTLYKQYEIKYVDNSGIDLNYLEGYNILDVNGNNLKDNFATSNTNLVFKVSVNSENGYRIIGEEKGITVAIAGEDYTIDSLNNALIVEKIDNNNYICSLSHSVVRDDIRIYVNVTNKTHVNVDGSNLYLTYNQEIDVDNLNSSLPAISGMQVAGKTFKGFGIGNIILFEVENDAYKLNVVDGYISEGKCWINTGNELILNAIYETNTYSIGYDSAGYKIYNSSGEEITSYSGTDDGLEFYLGTIAVGYEKVNQNLNENYVLNPYYVVQYKKVGASEWNDLPRLTYANNKNYYKIDNQYSDIIIRVNLNYIITISDGEDGAVVDDVVTINRSGNTWPSDGDLQITIGLNSGYYLKPSEDGNYYVYYSDTTNRVFRTQVTGYTKGDSTITFALNKADIKDNLTILSDIFTNSNYDALPEGATGDYATKYIVNNSEIVNTASITEIVVYNEVSQSLNYKTQIKFTLKNGYSLYKEDVNDGDGVEYKNYVYYKIGDGLVSKVEAIFANNNYLITLNNKNLTNTKDNPLQIVLYNSAIQLSVTDGYNVGVVGCESVLDNNLEENEKLVYTVKFKFDISNDLTNKVVKYNEQQLTAEDGVYTIQLKNTISAEIVVEDATI